MEIKRKSLLTRLTEKLKFGTILPAFVNGNFKKRVPTTAIATVIGASVLLSGCDFEDNQLPTKISEALPTDSNGEAVSLEPEESEFLDIIIDNEDYQQAMNEHLAGNDDLMKAYSHPLGFLADEGFNVEEIKSGELEFVTSSYVKESEPNSLYVYSSILIEGETEETTYYSKYLLRYDLTDNEMQAYKQFYDNNTVEASMAIGVLSEFKQATVVASSNVMKINHDAILNSRVHGSQWDVPISDIMVIGYSIEDQSCQYLVFSEDGGKISTYDIKRCINLSTIEIDNSTIMILGGFFGDNEAFNDFVKNTELATYYKPDANINLNDNNVEN